MYGFISYSCTGTHERRVGATTAWQVSRHATVRNYKIAALPLDDGTAYFEATIKVPVLQNFLLAVNTRVTVLLICGRYFTPR